MIEEQTKARYFDSTRMIEVYMERHVDILYCKQQRVTQAPDWNDTPTKQRTTLVYPSSQAKSRIDFSQIRNKATAPTDTSENDGGVGSRPECSTKKFFNVSH